MQEIVLGIGGWQLLSTLGINPEVCHLNEGHAALAVLERARQFMASTGQSFHAALATTRAGNVFTTHTAVPAGFDRFPPAVVDHCLGGYARRQLGISIDELLALGRQNASDAREDFNMAYLAMRSAGAANGVSRLHGQVSRRLFQPLFRRWPESEVPVGHVTNGVHVPTWDSAAADSVWTQSCGQNRWLQSTETLEADIRRVDDASLWNMRNIDRRLLINYARDRLRDQLEVAGASESDVARARRAFDPDALTLGFARRFATYKRPTLLLHDPERLLRLLANGNRPVQLIVAGKAHPDDLAGQALVSQWARFAQLPEARDHVMFLADYDMLLTEHMVRGMDVWINTPRRPWEASGTSGMKVLVNGGLNVSELDGWWAEAYAPEVGWAIGDGREHDDDPSWDAAEARRLYDLLEQSIVPQFYDRDARGIPVAWIARMRESMARLTPYFSTNRVVRQYTNDYYLPAAARFRERAKNGAAGGKAIADWQVALARSWPHLRFDAVDATTRDGQHRFEARVFLAELTTEAVQVEIFANGTGTGPPIRSAMAVQRDATGGAGYAVYRGAAPTTRPLSDYTVRLIPRHPDAAIPLEAPQILWER
jgi:starch phosphorylase